MRAWSRATFVSMAVIGAMLFSVCEESQHRINFQGNEAVF
jgi:hypothetical protein